jgi:hypothetical protein
MSNQLSQLPVELLFQILDHVSIFDILLNICLVNKQLRTISLAYPRFQLNLNDCFNKKKQFDQLSRQLINRSSQIISLTIENEYYDATSPIIDNFFSKCIIMNRNFSRLCSLTLCDVNSKIWNFIKTQLTSWITLTAISINFITESKTPLTASIILHELLFFSSSLKSLSLATWNYPVEIVTIDYNRTSSIEYLYLDYIGIDLQSLFKAVPLLLSFTVINDYNHLIEIIDEHPFTNLQRLSITFDKVTLNKIERLLTSMPCLTHFKLLADDVLEDLANGDKWAQLLSRIKIFKFIFNFHQNAFRLKPFYLHSFHKNFWLIEKKWYVTYDWCIDTHHRLLYSNSYCLNDYPFNKMIGTFVTESTDPQLTTFPHIKHLDVSHRLLVNNTLLRRCTHISNLCLTTSNLNEILSWQYAITYLDSTKITYLKIDTSDTETSLNTTAQFVHDLPCLRSLHVSVTILRSLLRYNWPQIFYLWIVWGSDRSSKLLKQNEIDLFSSSFSNLQQFRLARCFIDDIPRLINGMMMTLSYLSIENIPQISADADGFISYQWIKQNTKLRNIEYLCDESNNVHIWF